MVNFRKLSERAKVVVEKRGGTENLKADAEQLKQIAKGKGKLSDKAKAAAAALKEPGAAEPAAGTAAASAAPHKVQAEETAADGEARGTSAEGGGADRGPV